MKDDVSSNRWPLLTIIGIVCAAALMAMIIQSFVRLFRSPPENKTDKNAVTAASVRSGALPDKKAISVFAEHPIIIPPAKPVSSPVPPRAHPEPAPERAVLNTDFQKMQDREKGRRETIGNIRRQAGENPDAGNIPSEEQLKKIEESGADFL